MDNFSKRLTPGIRRRWSERNVPHRVRCRSSSTLAGYVVPFCRHLTGCPLSRWVNDPIVIANGISLLASMGRRQFGSQAMKNCTTCICTTRYALWVIDLHIYSVTAVPSLYIITHLLPKCSEEVKRKRIGIDVAQICEVNFETCPQIVWHTGKLSY